MRVYNTRYQQPQANKDQAKNYDEEEALLFGLVMCHYNNKMLGMNDKEDYIFIQTYRLKQGIENFGDQGKQTERKEIKQLHGRVVFEPIHVNDLTKDEHKKAMKSLIFLTEKRDGSVKACTCANGSTQGKYVTREETYIPTAATQSIMMTGVIDAKQGQDVMTLDIPNDFVQTNIPEEDKKVIMKI